MVGLLVLAILAANPVQQEKSDVVIVTTRTLGSTERALAECLARSCPPKQDIEASLAHGENLFVAGQYAAARTVLRKSRERNARYAATLPVDVADLNRAYGRMAAVNGYSDNSRLAQIESLDALKAGLDRDDSRVLMQRLLVANEYLSAGRVAAADDILADVENQAAAAGLTQVRGLTMLRRAAVYATIAGFVPEYRSSARIRLKRLMNTTEPGLAPFRDAAVILQAQDVGDRKDEKALNAIISTVDASRETVPRLVYAPAIDLQPNARSRSTTVYPTGEDRPQFIDVSFAIDRTGRVKDIDIVRQSDTVAGSWPELVEKALAERRYLPIGPNVDPALLRRTERFSMVYNVVRRTGSRIASRSPTGRIISLDLTAEPQLVDAKPQGAMPSETA